MTHSLSRVLVVTICLIALVSIAGCLDTTAPWSTETESATEQTATINATAAEMWIHRFVNEERQARELDPVARNETLDEIAQYHSTDMADSGYYGHESPSGETMKDRYVRFEADCWESYGEVRYFRGAENIARTYHHTRINVTGAGTRYHEAARELARGLVDQWMNSTGHRENILTPDWTAEGIGIHIDDTTVYATQNFCKSATSG